MIGNKDSEIHNLNPIYQKFISTYGKCSKNLHSFLFLFLNKMLVIRAGTHKMLVIIANRGDPDQTASEAV